MTLGRAILVVPVAVACLLFAACAKRDVGTLMSAADTAFDGQRYSEAAIEYRNVLDKDSSHALARLKLGRSYFEMGEYARAIVEYDNVAAGGKIARAEIDILKARALLRSGRPNEAINLARSAAERDQALASEADLILGEASVLLANWETASRVFNEVDPLDQPLYRRSLMGRAAIARHFGEMRQAEALLSSALDLPPANLDALESRAAVRQALGDLQGARIDLDILISEARRRGDKRKQAEALRILFGIQVAGRHLDEAESTLSMISASFAGSALELSTKAVLLQARGDSEGARIAAQQALSIEPDSIELLLLNATMAAAGGHIEQAERLARRAVALDPGNETAARLVASIALRDGRYDEAEEVLLSLDSRSESDLQLIVAQGLSNLRRGLFDESIRLFERGVALAPENQLVRAGLARSYLASGNYGGAATHLAAILDEPADSASLANIIELLSVLQEGDSEGALASARRVTETDPENARGWLALGLVRQSLGHLADAEVAATRALELSAEFASALRFRAEVRDSLGNREGAIRDLAAVAALHPNDSAAVRRHARILQDAGRLGEATGLLNRYLKANAGDVDVLFQLSLLQLASNNIPAADAIANRMAEVAPDEVQTTLARVQVAYAAGRKQVALQSLTGLARRLPDDRGIQMSLARLQMELGNIVAARETLTTVVRSNPADTRAVELWCESTVRLGILDEGEACAQKIRTDRPESSRGYSLMGWLLLQQGRSDEATTQFARAFGKSDSREDLVSLVRAHLLAGRGNPEALLRERLARKPDDFELRLLLAEVLMAGGNSESAIAEYSVILEMSPTSVAAGNNLAWLLQESDPDRAEQIALRTAQAAPHNPDVLDTAGWILLNNGDIEAAVNYLRQAADLGSKNPEVMYHLAVAMKMSGSPEDAVGLLREALDQNRPFASREDAKSLLAALEDDLEVKDPDE